MRVPSSFAIRVLTLISFVLLALGAAQTKELQESVSYIKSVEPIFQNRCVVCHSHTGRQGGLNLESYEGLMNGGKHGAVIVAGKSDESRLVKLITGAVQPQMPPGDSLNAEEIKTIRAWVDAGARGPNGATTKPELLTTPAVETNNSASKIPNIKPKVPVNAAVTSLAFQPGGQAGGQVIALGRYKEVELINVDARADMKPDTGKLAGEINQVRALAFSPDGKLLAAAGGNPGQFGEIKIWDVTAQKELRSWRGHRDNIFSIAFSPDGTKLATCSYDRMIKLWEVATGAEIKNLKDHTDAVFAIAFSPNGKLLASASADRTIKIWDIASGQRLYTLGDSLDAVNALAFHPSGKMIAGAGADRTIRIWQLGASEGKQIKSSIAHGDAITQIAFSPDGALLATTGADKLLKIWNPSDLVEIHTFERQSDWVFALAFSPDGKRLAVGRYDGSVAFYDPASGEKGSKKARPSDKKLKGRDGKVKGRSQTAH